MTRHAYLLKKLRRKHLRPMQLDGIVLKNACPITAAYVLMAELVFWALPLAFASSESIEAMWIYKNLPGVGLHIWDVAALLLALTIRRGIARADLRLVQVAAALSLTMYFSAGIFFIVALGSTAMAFVYVPFCLVAFWILYLTRDTWVDASEIVDA